MLKYQGRLENSGLDANTKFPILLPREHALTDIIVRDCHARINHEGIKVTLAEI